MVIEKMHEGKLSDQTIVTHTRVLKMVVRSKVTSEGEEVFPRKWNHDFVGMPIIDPAHSMNFGQSKPSSNESTVPETAPTAKSIAVPFAHL